jgi:nucleoside-diphosphate-sugar epimerase
MNILITGATGFIGRHLTNALSKVYPVRCLVRKNSDITVLKNSNVEIFYGDLLIKESLKPALEQITLVYHLAGEVYSNRKSDYYKGNILATKNLLEVCEEKDIKRIIFLSSVGVYKPVNKKILLNEESECGPITYYGKTKLHAEELIKNSNINWVIVRAPVVYGPYQPSILNQFFISAFKKRKVYIIGKGDNLRSFCYIDNLIEGLILLLKNTEVKGKTFIFSDNSPYTINEIIETGSRIINKEVKVINLPNFLGNISWAINYVLDNFFNLCFVQLYAMKKMQLEEGYDISKAKKEIGYNPKISLEEGIRKTIEWIKI